MGGLRDALSFGNIFSFRDYCLLRDRPSAQQRTRCANTLRLQRLSIRRGCFAKKRFDNSRAQRRNYFNGYDPFRRASFGRSRCEEMDHASSATQELAIF